MNKTPCLIVLFVCCFLNTQAQQVDIELFANGLNSPLGLENAGDSRMFVLERAGTIQVLNASGTANATPFLDISTLVSTSGEGGLVGLAFHPNYQTNGFFFVQYTDNDGDSQITRYAVSASDPDIADPTSALSILEIEQPFATHNGSTLTFGPEGYLFIGSGDGGSGGDPGNRAQDLSELLGKILRIDIDNASGGMNYSIPSDNPFVGDSGVREEIWAYGLRNPWKFSIDEDTNDIWIADVGQGEVEEINRQNVNEGGLNYGWRCYEGSEPFNTDDCPDPGTLSFPFYEYSSGPGSSECSVSGGIVYRGAEFNGFQGLYFYADFCSGLIGSIDTDGNVIDHGDFSSGLVGFGEDVNKNLYVISISQNAIFKIINVDLGVDENSKLDFTLIPNPSSQYINLQIESETIDTVSILDIQGAPLFSEKNIDQTKMQFNVSNFSSGIYLVHVIAKSGISETKKLVIE